MNYRLFLDDVRYPENVHWIEGPYDSEWTIVRNYNEFVKMIETCGMPEMISFDHDLAEEHYNPETWEDSSAKYKEKTGNDCAKWLVEHCIEKNLNMPEYLIHSMNPIGRKRISDTIDDLIRYRTLH